jgi:hypothetical protein
MTRQKCVRILFVLALATFGSAIASSAPTPKRSLIGPRPLVQKLWHSAKSAKVPMWKPSEFTEQEFRYLGQTQSNNPYHLVNFVTIWGQAQRATKRLLVFDSRCRLVGMYSHLDPEVLSLKGNQLILESGQADFSVSPPAKIENSEFESGAAIRKGY